MTARLTDPEILRGVGALVAFAAIVFWLVLREVRSDDGQGPEAWS